MGRAWPPTSLLGPTWPLTPTWGVGGATNLAPTLGLSQQGPTKGGLGNWPVFLSTPLSTF